MERVPRTIGWRLPGTPWRPRMERQWRRRVDSRAVVREDVLGHIRRRHQPLGLALGHRLHHHEEPLSDHQLDFLRD